MTTPFVFQPYLSRGSSTPAVARTMLQTGELIQAFPLTEEKREAVKNVSHEVMLRLIACLDQSDQVVAQVRAGKDAISKTGVEFNPGRTAAQLPAVVDLRQRVEQFLYAAKGALREIGKLFGPFEGKSFDHKFHKVRDWLEATRGPDDSLLLTLKQDSTWIEQILNMRNAVDHPGTPSTLHVDNFRLVGVSPAIVLEPTWRLDDFDRSAIACDMPVLVDNLLTLYEDILNDCLVRMEPRGPLTIVEVPMEQRDPSMPIRFRVGLTISIPPT